MKYFIDTEFHEYQKKPLFGKPIDTIELISIGIVNEGEKIPDKYIHQGLQNGDFKLQEALKGNTSREYYAISKDFDLKAAWNNFQMKQVYGDARNTHPDGIKEYWLRDNVLKPIWIELSLLKDSKYSKDDIEYIWDNLSNRERYVRMKLLLFLYGKSNEQIAEDIVNFIYPFASYNDKDCKTSSLYKTNEKSPEFYAYYADYDWVVFCWLFGRMIDLPKGFPMYCIDLKQTLDEMQKLENASYKHELNCNGITKNPLKVIKDLPNYPKQSNEHNALSDAKWNYELYKFLNSL